MAQQTLEKNSVLKFFEIFKDKFFKIILLNAIYTTAALILFAIIFGINQLAVAIFGSFSNAWALLLFLPLALMGPVTGAITKVCRDFVREEPGFFLEDLKKAFRENFRQCLGLGVLQYFAVWAVYIAFNFYYAGLDHGMIYTIGLGVTIFFGIAFIVASYYFYMMAVTLKLSFREVVKNSFIFTLLCFLRNVLLTFLLAAWCIAIGYYIYITIISANAFLYGLAIIIIMLLFFGFIFFSIAFFTFPPIKKHILDPYYEEHPLESSKGVTDKAQTNGIDYNGLNEENDLPEFVYHNGKMVHRSALEEQQVFRDENKLDNND